MKNGKSGAWKMKTKEEIILAFDAIWFEANNSANLAGEDLQKEHDLIIKLINEHFELVEEYKSCRQELDGYYELLYPDPYKFEELHEGMLVWDDEYKIPCQVLKVMSFDKLSVSYHFESIIEYQEDRFYPITKAYQEKE